MGNGSCKNCGIRNSCLKRGVYEYNGIDCNKCWQPTEGRPVVKDLRTELRLLKDNLGRDAWEYFQEGLVSKTLMIQLIVDKIETMKEGK